MRSSFQRAVLGHELAHVEQQRGTNPVIQAYIDPRLARIDEPALARESNDDLERMQREVIAELQGPAQRNRADSEWNLAIIQAALVQRGRPITPYAGSRLTANPSERASAEQIAALQTRIDVVIALARRLFDRDSSTLIERLTQLRTDVERLHRDAVLDEGDKLATIQSALEATAGIKAATPTEASADPTVAAAQQAVFDAIPPLVRDLGTAAQSERIAALTRVSDHYSDLYSAALIGTLERAKVMMNSGDAAFPAADAPDPGRPPRDDAPPAERERYDRAQDAFAASMFMNGYARNGRIVLGASMSERDDCASARTRLLRDLNRLGDLARLRAAPYAERAAFLRREGENVPKLLRRAQALALVRAAYSTGGALMNATSQTDMMRWTDAITANQIRDRVIRPLTEGLSSSDGPSEATLRSAQLELNRHDATMRSRLQDIATFQRRFGYFVQFAVLAMSLWGGGVAARIAAGPMPLGGTMTVGMLVRSSLAFTATSSLITTGLTGNVPTVQEQLQQYATDLATFGLLHGVGLGLAGRYGGAANVPVGVRFTAEIGTLWLWSTTLGIAAHVGATGSLSLTDAGRIASDAANHTAQAVMAMHLAHHMGSMPTVTPDYTDPATRAARQAAMAEFERVRAEGRNVQRELTRWRDRGQSDADLDPILQRAERFYGSYRSAVRALENAGVIGRAEASALAANVRGEQVVRNVRTASRLGVRSTGSHTVAYSAEVRNVDMFLRQLQRQGTVRSFEPTGRGGIYRVEHSDGSWALWFPEGPATGSGRGFDLPAQVMADAYPNLPPEVRARALANLSRLPPGEGNRVLATMSGAEGEALVRWMARGDVGGSQFLSGAMLEAFLRDPAQRGTLSSANPADIQRWYEVPFEQIYGDRSGANFMRFLADVRARRGTLAVATRGEALTIGGEIRRSSNVDTFVPQDTHRPSYWLAPGSSAPPDSPRVQVSNRVRGSASGTYHEVDSGGLTYVFNVDGGSVYTVYIFRGSRFLRGLPVADRVRALREGIAAADALTDAGAKQAALDALAPLATDLAFLRDVRGVPVADIVPLLDRVRPRGASPLPDVRPPDPPAIVTPTAAVPITHLEVNVLRRRALLERARRMGMSDDPLISQLREWNPELPDQGRRVANPDALMGAVETFLDGLRDARMGRLFQPPPRACFAAGTPVVTDEGLTAIENVTPGMRVSVRDPESGAICSASVQARMQLKAQSLRIVTLVDGSMITTTDEHPFWVAGCGWRSARQLLPGDQLWGHAGAVAIAAICESPGETEVWNLEVDGLHAFAIGAGGTVVHNKAMPADPVVHGLIAAGAEWTYRHGGTSRLETALRATGNVVRKTADRVTGLRTLAMEQPGGLPDVVLRERPRYADVGIDMTTLPAPEQGAITNLFTRYGITDPVIQGRVLEAIEAARIVEGGPPQPIAAAIGRVRPMLEAARAEGLAGGGTRTTQDVLAARGNTPLADARSLPLIPDAERAIAEGILTDTRFLAARTRAEVRDLLADRMQEDLVANRATTTHGLSGGRVLRRVRIVGNLYDTETTTVMRRANTDVVPDIDVVYVVERGGVLQVAYSGQGKVTSGAVSAADAARQNSLGQAALSASGRFEVVTREGTHLWAEVTRIEATEHDGRVVDVTGLRWGSGVVMETIGSHGRGGFDVTMPPESAAGRLDRIADLIWRLRELRSRPHLASP